MWCHDGYHHAIYNLNIIYDINIIDNNVSQLQWVRDFACLFNGTKNNKLPITCIRTQTLLCTLQRGDSDHSTTDQVTENSSSMRGSYIHMLVKYHHQDQACWKWMHPVLKGSLPTVAVMWYHTWYHRPFCSICWFCSTAAFSSSRCSGLAQVRCPQSTLPETLPHWSLDGEEPFALDLSLQQHCCRI